MYAIFAPTIVKPECIDDFVAVSITNAKTSLHDEPGCFRFDLMRDRENPHRFQFYEVYRDQAAFNLHEASAHYAAWVEATKGMIGEESPYVIMDSVFCSDDEVS